MRVLITGGNGFLGRNIRDSLSKDASIEVLAPGRDMLDCRDLASCVKASAGADCVIHAAVVLQRGDATPYQSFYENTLINTNILEAVRINKVPRIIAFGTILSYTNSAAAPFKEDNLLTAFSPSGKREYVASKSYLLFGMDALHKSAGTDCIFLVMPNLFGKHDKFDPAFAHFVPSTISRISSAKATGAPGVTFLGQGVGKREFAYADDIAAIIHKLLGVHGFHILNAGSGDAHHPREVAEAVAKLLDYRGNVSFAPGKADELFMDCGRLRGLIGEIPHTPFDEALRKTIEWYKRNPA